jgi:type III pantothenate kinase
MLLLLDIGNSHTHAALAGAHGLRRQMVLPTQQWFGPEAEARLARWVGTARLSGAALCSVVPQATLLTQRALSRQWRLRALELTHRTVAGLGLNYPKPETIGPDRLANALAARHCFGAPVVAVDFGTATTIDVVDRQGNFRGGIIAPGLAALADYLHEKTALLPRVKLRQPRRAIGRSTEEAILIGVVCGYRGLVRELLKAIRRELGGRRVPVVATGGCARLVAAGLPEIKAVVPELTLTGLRLAWLANRGEAGRGQRGRGAGEQGSGGAGERGSGGARGGGGDSLAEAAVKWGEAERARREGIRIRTE